MPKKKEIDIEELNALYDGGMSTTELAERYHVSQSTVYDRLRRTGRGGRMKFCPSDGAKQDIIQRYKDGYSSTYLGKRYGVSPGTIIRLLRESKVWIRPSIAVILHMCKRPQDPNRERRHRRIHGPKKSPAGYTVVYAPEHPRADRNGYVWEHVLVMEKELGRYLAADEVVHHIDRNKSNNDPSNLLAMTKSQHAAIHYAEKRDRMRYHTPPKIRGELEAVALELYESGKTDPQIAAAIGVHTGTVLKWRRRNGIEGNAKLKFDRDRAMGLYRDKRTDTAIAAELGVSKLTVQRWRKEHGLERVDRCKVAGEKAVAARAMYDDGMSDKQIADKLGVNHGNVAYWRQRMGLRPNYRPPSKLTDEDVEAINASGEKTRTLAERYRVAEETIRAVRRGDRRPSSAAS